MIFHHAFPLSFGLFASTQLADLRRTSSGVRCVRWRTSGGFRKQGAGGMLSDFCRCIFRWLRIRSDSAGGSAPYSVTSPLSRRNPSRIPPAGHWQKVVGFLPVHFPLAACRWTTDGNPGGFSSERTLFLVGPPADPLRFHWRNLALSLVRSLGVIVPGFHQRCTGRMLSDFCLWIFRWLTAGVSSHRCSPPSDLMHFFGTAIWELRQQVRSRSAHLNHCK